jgi:hypothetical protein
MDPEGMCPRLSGLKFVEFGERERYSSPRMEPNPLPSRRRVSARMKSALGFSSVDGGGWWPTTELEGEVTFKDFSLPLSLYCIASTVDSELLESAVEDVRSFNPVVLVLRP